MVNYPYNQANKVYPEIVSFARGDVNGDGIPDNVYLTGVRTQASPFIQNITLVIQDGRTGTSNSVSLQYNAGYSPAVYLFDFTGDGIEDILISITSGGSGGITYYYIYSFLGNRAIQLFDFELYNQQYQYVVTYKDNYKAEVYSRINNMRYTIDISYKGADYLNEIYDDNGKLKNPIQGFVDPLSGLFPIDFDANKVYDLLGFQQIAGRYHADSLGYVQNQLKWNGSTFVLDRQYVAIPGV